MPRRNTPKSGPQASPEGGARDAGAGFSAASSTLANWARLGSGAEGRLQSRANKTRSQKRVMPAEYASVPRNAHYAFSLAARIGAAGCGAMEAFWSLCQNLLRRAGIAAKPSCAKALSEYSSLGIRQDLLDEDLPGEPDVLGLVYESYLSEGQRNERGCYYTPRAIALEMLEGMDLKAGGSLLDPCCGSGALLLAADARDPGQLCGIDADPVAVMLARTNLLLKYRDHDFVPDVRCADFLDGKTDLGGRRFDFIAANPPWGARIGRAPAIAGISLRESASLVLAKSCSLLREGGRACFLLPEAELNVSTHRELRKFLLDRVDLAGIKSYGRAFSGVMTGFAAVSFNKGAPSGRPVLAVTPKWRRLIDPLEFKGAPNLVFSLIPASEAAIVRKCRRRGELSLRDSAFALGIVTGDNRRLLSKERAEGMEPIYTGREIKPYRLLEPGLFIRYDRRAFQQAAPDWIYRRKDKLAYKFISGRLAFACDRGGSLFLNSANLLVPKVPGMGAMTVMAFLNSSLMSFLYSRMFAGVKILKGNLMELPLPRITAGEDAELSRLALAASQGDEAAPHAIDELVLGIFGLDSGERGEVIASTRPRGNGAAACDG